MYNDVLYDTVAKFRDAWSSPSFQKLPKSEGGDWLTQDRSGEAFSFDSEPGPIQLSLTQRFTVDYSNKYVEWMGFSFYIGVTDDRGLGLHNINYDNERIIYELGNHCTNVIQSV
jgi:primary-amine oxidase